jgi:uncharacterized protein YndB with AHSA1/START domain
VAFHGTFLELVPGEQIVSTEVFEAAPPEAETVNTITFAEADGGTKLTILIECRSAEVRDTIVDSGMEAGLQDALDLLEDVVS